MGTPTRIVLTCIANVTLLPHAGGRAGDRMQVCACTQSLSPKSQTPPREGRIHDSACGTACTTSSPKRFKLRAVCMRMRMRLDARTHTHGVHASLPWLVYRQARSQSPGPPSTLGHSIPVHFAVLDRSVAGKRASGRTRAPRSAGPWGSRFGPPAAEGSEQRDRADQWVSQPSSRRSYPPGPLPPTCAAVRVAAPSGSLAPGFWQAAWPLGKSL